MKFLKSQISMLTVFATLIGLAQPALAKVPNNPAPSQEIALRSTKEKILSGTLERMMSFTSVKYQLVKKDGTSVGIVFDRSVESKVEQLIGQPVLLQGLDASTAPMIESGSMAVFYAYFIELNDVLVPAP
jgi:hypothetical protein